MNWVSIAKNINGYDIVQANGTGNFDAVATGSDPSLPSTIHVYSNARYDIVLQLVTGNSYIPPQQQVSFSQHRNYFLDMQNRQYLG